MRNFTRIVTGLLVAGIVSLAAACSSSSNGGGNEEDGSFEGGFESGVPEDSPSPATDAPADGGSGADATDGASQDSTMPESGADGSAEAAADAPAETSTEAGPEASTDAAVDHVSPPMDAAGEASPPMDASGTTDASPPTDSAPPPDAPATDSSPPVDAATEASAGESSATPVVTTTAPAAGTTGIAGTAAVSVTFDAAMNPATVTTNTADTTCSGSLQVSGDGFSTCVQMSAAPVASGGDTAFTVTPAASLESLGSYSIRVTTGAESAGGTPLAAAFTTSSPFVVRYFHTIVIDGINDFASNETFATTSSGYTGYIAWDATNLYVGVDGSDVASGDANKFVVVYLGGSPGTTTGVTYNTQTPTLPFAAAYHVRWSADNVFTDALAWSGSAWVEAGWNFSGLVYESGAYLEMAIPLANIGSPTSLPIVLSMLNQTNNVEATYSGVPSSSFTDMYNPSYATYLELELQASTAPVDSAIEN